MTVILKKRAFISESTLWFIIIILPFVLFVIYPFLVMLKASFIPGDLLEPTSIFEKITFFIDNFTLKFYKKILITRYLRRLYNTLIFAGLNTGVSLLIGVPLAIYLFRRKFFGSQALTTLLLIPYMIPNYILVLATITVTGKNGLINMILRWIFNDPEFALPLKVMHTYHGVLLVLIFHGIPLVIFIVMAVLSSIDKNYMEAAIGLGASPFKAIVRIILPMAFPGIIAAGSIIFAQTMCNYVIVTLMGGIQYANLAVEIFNQYFGYDTFDFASALSVVLSLMTMGIMYAYFILMRKKIG